MTDQVVGKIAIVTPATVPVLTFVETGIIVTDKAWTVGRGVLQAITAM